MNKEVEDKKMAKILFEERREKLLAEKKEKQEKLLRQEQEKRERKQKKRMLEERWAMARWITEYIDKNSERWKTEKEQRKRDEKETAEEWKKMKRLEKIRVLKENIFEKEASKKL